MKASSAALEAKTDGAVGGQPYEVVGITVAKPLPGQEENYDMRLRWNTGTTISLMVRSSDLSIIDMDNEASKVTSFVDEKKNDLLKSTGKLQSMHTGMFAPTEPVSCRSIDGEGQWAMVAFHAPSVPAAGCKSVTIKADIVLQAGLGSTVAEHKDIPLSGKGKFKVGDATITVKKQDAVGDEFKMKIALESKGSFNTIKDFTFLNSSGKEIEYRPSGSGWMGDTNVIWMTLAEEVETVTIKTDTYEKFDTIRIPVTLEVGVGF